MGLSCCPLQLQLQPRPCVRLRTQGGAFTLYRSNKLNIDERAGVWVQKGSADGGTWRSLHTEQREGRMCFEGRNREAGSGASTGCAAREGVHPVRCRAGRKIGWAAAMKSRGCAAEAGGPRAHQRPSGRGRKIRRGRPPAAAPSYTHTKELRCAALCCAARSALASLSSCSASQPSQSRQWGTAAGGAGAVSIEGG